MAEKYYGGNLAKTFNTAKKYAEEILFPKMDSFQKYQKQAAFGDEDLNAAIYLDNEVRDIQRYNGLKAMNNILYNLLLNISSTVKINKKKAEIKMLDKMINISRKLEIVFNEDQTKFFSTKYIQGKNTEELNRVFFLKVKDTIEKMYINCEILMTKNKLLFAETTDDFMDDKEIIKTIKDEYIGN